MNVFKEQQRAAGFDTAGIERLHTVALDSTSHDGFVSMLKRLAALDSTSPAGSVAMLNDNGTVSVVSLKQAIKSDNAIMKALQEEKAYRPCLACGTHPCPPGSFDLCFVSTALAIPNTLGAGAVTQLLLDAWITEHNYDPYNEYDEHGALVLN